jgi:hypothetical protein
MSKAYDTYIIEHCNAVKTAYEWLVRHKIIENSYWPVINTHDVSKWSESEYNAYDKYFYGKSKTKEVKEAFNFAWLHHIHNNPHHWQHWVLVNDEDGTVALEMPEEYLVEMICDHWSFSHKTNNLTEIFDWYKKHKSNMILHPNTKKAYEAILDKIKAALEGEKE